MIKLIEITSTSCGMCKMMKPMIKKAMSNFSKEDLDFVSVHGDTERGKEIIDKYGLEVNSVPSFFFIGDNDEILYSFTGAVALPVLINKIKEYVK